MRLQQDRQLPWSDLNHNSEVKVSGRTGRMPHVLVRENAVKWWVSVHGLNHHEIRLLAEKVADQPETHDDREKLVEFSVPSWQVLNALERLGYRVVTSSSIVTGFGKHDTR
jgi:hypothetical protein